MEPHASAESPRSWDRVLAQNPETIASNIRQAVTECQGAISKLTLRNEVPPGELSRMQREITDVIASVTQIRDRLLSTDRQMKVLSTDPLVKRYFQIIQDLEKDSEGHSPSRRRSLEQERDLILKEVSPILRRLRGYVRACLVLRLEMIRYWKWILKRAIDIYVSFKLVVRASLRTIFDQIQDPSLHQLVQDVIAHEEPLSVEMFNSARHWFTQDLEDIDQQAVKELKDLCAIESHLKAVRESAAELENSEILIHQEILQSGKETPPEEPSPPARLLIRGLETVNRAEDPANPPRVFKRPPA